VKCKDVDDYLAIEKESRHLFRGADTSRTKWEREDNAHIPGPRPCRDRNG
jgi:hypothetical protein